MKEKRSIVIKLIEKDKFYISDLVEILTKKFSEEIVKEKS